MWDRWRPLDNPALGRSCPTQAFTARQGRFTAAADRQQALAIRQASRLHPQAGDSAGQDLSLPREPGGPLGQQTAAAGACADGPAEPHDGVDAAPDAPSWTWARLTHEHAMTANDQIPEAAMGQAEDRASNPTGPRAGGGGGDARLQLFGRVSMKYTPLPRVDPRAGARRGQGPMGSPIPATDPMSGARRPAAARQKQAERSSFPFGRP